MASWVSVPLPIELPLRPCTAGTRISQDNGGGFVESPYCQYQHGRDAFLDQTTIANAFLREGDFVVFDVYVNPQGSPQVSDPLWKNPHLYFSA